MNKTPNPNVTIQSGETAEPLSAQTPAFYLPGDTRARCVICHVPMKLSIIGPTFCRAHEPIEQVAQ